MTKLWNKGYSLNQTVEAFMTGDDPSLDVRLLKYDCYASIAHARMLQKIGILNIEELSQLETCLAEVLELDANGQFNIEATDEDVHTALENYLVGKLGDTGKKIHTARSRNDQVLTAIRLFMKEYIKSTVSALCSTLDVLVNFAVTNSNIPYAGRTHFQKAMPASIGLWMGAYVESLIDDIMLLKSSHDMIDQSPLGSAASYGVMLNIDREFTAHELGFSKVQNNVLYANNSRGKFESVLIHGLSQIMVDFSKLATDVILFSAPEFGYLKLPVEFCPGSSLMPNKKNPDPFELIRAKSAIVVGNLFKILEIIRCLPSGYNRDYQETKRPLFEACDTTLQTIEVIGILFSGITIDSKACLASLTPDVFATDKVISLVKDGVAFRDAYKNVGTHLEEVVAEDPLQNILSKTHTGATACLNLDHSVTQIQQLKQWSIEK